MKKLALPLAVAASLAFAAPTSTPARADGGATAAIIAAVIVGGAVFNHATCGQPVCWWWAAAPAATAVKGPVWNPIWHWYHRSVTVKSRKKA